MAQAQTKHKLNQVTIGGYTRDEIDAEIALEDNHLPKMYEIPINYEENDMVNCQVVPTNRPNNNNVFYLQKHTRGHDGKPHENEGRLFTEGESFQIEFRRAKPGLENGILRVITEEDLEIDRAIAEAKEKARQEMLDFKLALGMPADAALPPNWRKMHDAYKTQQSEAAEKEKKAGGAKK